MIKVIWSDDIFKDRNQVLSSTDYAYEQGIVLVAKQTWDETVQELEIAGDTFDAIILDGKGQKTIDSKTNDTGHLTQAMGWLSEQRGRGISYPIIIHTGFYEDIHELYGEDQTIMAIVKKPYIDQVYDKIKGAVADLQNIKIKQKYQNAWCVFNNKILSSDLEQKLLNIIKKYENQNTEKSDFNTIREVFEGLLKRFNDIDGTDNLLPNEVLKTNGSINFDYSIKILKGYEITLKDEGGRFIRTIQKNYNSVIPFKHHIGYCFDFVKDTSSAFSHTYSHKYGDTTYAACLLALLEILNWSNDFILSKYEDKLQ